MLPLNSHSPRTPVSQGQAYRAFCSTLPSGLRQLKARIMSRGLTGAQQNRHNANTPPVPAGARQKSQLLLVHSLHLGPKSPLQQARVSLCIHHRSVSHRAPAPTPATFPLAGQINGQRKGLQYTQKQSSVTTNSRSKNRGCCPLVFIRILASNNQQDPPGGIYILWCW